jgi:hypothetical protein
MFTLADQANIQESGIPGVQNMVLTFKTPTTQNYDIYTSYIYDSAITFSATRAEIH